MGHDVGPVEFWRQDDGAHLRLSLNGVGLGERDLAGNALGTRCFVGPRRRSREDERLVEDGECEDLGISSALFDVGEEGGEGWEGAVGEELVHRRVRAEAVVERGAVQRWLGASVSVDVLDSMLRHSRQAGRERRLRACSVASGNATQSFGRTAPRES